MVSVDLAIDPAWVAPLSLEQYHRMIDAGVLGADDHVELLEGVIVAMSPQEKPHAWVIRYLDRRFQQAAGDDLWVNVQLPLTLARSEPEPDLSVTRAGAPWPRGRHPETAELVVEVASDSLRKDRGLKAAIYAEAGVVEYWIVNVADRWVEVLRDPDPATRTYRTVTRAHPGESLTPAVLPAVAVAVAELFTPAE